MIFIKLKYWFLLLAIGFLNGCSAQNTGVNHVLVFKVEHTNSKYVGYSYVAYSLLDLEKIKNFKSVDNDSIDSPNITYNITANGGNVIDDSFIDFETFGCCEYGDVEKAVEQKFSGTLPKEKLSKYLNVNELSLDEFSDDKGINFLYKEGTATYEITVWLADLEYCQCGIYMGNVSKDIDLNKGARLKSINSISKPNQEVKKEIEMILKNLIELDVKH
ncbi:MAG: hypothetical protein U9R42_03740 [Bacteroidota bacterium]|nr:hypothetical protein [Bacteroidota bacterium]